MKKYYFLIIVALILGLVLAGCSLLSNVGQVPATDQSGVTYLTKAILSPDDLVGLWHFDGDALDSSGDANNGMVHGAVYVDSPMGQALSFDGVDDYVEVIDSPSLRVQEFTIEAWVNLDKLLGRQIIIRKSIDSVWGSFSLQVEQDSHLLLTVQDKTNGKWPVWRTTSPLAAIGWYHISGTFKKQNYDASDGKIYIDGSAQTTTFTANGYATGFIIEYTTGSLFIGMQHGQSYPLDGTIDEVRIWKVALSPDQLDEVYDWAGFFPPVDSFPAYNAAKAGSAIPVKFSLNGNQGLDIFEDGYPKSMPIECDGTGILGEIEVTVTAGKSSLSYDTDADQYIYVWKTDKSWAGTCRKLILLLNDGTYHEARFTFKK